MTRERAIHELSRSEYDVVCLLMLTTKFDNTRWPWRRAVATSVVGVAADLERCQHQASCVHTSRLFNFFTRFVPNEMASPAQACSELVAYDLYHTSIGRL